MCLSNQQGEIIMNSALKATVESSLTAKQLALYELNKKSIGVAYLLGFVFGMIGIHCFYAKQPEHGLFRLAMCILSFGIPPLYFVCIAVFIADAFLTVGWVNEYNDRILATIVD
jgi:TM2 domain-containing membrane protein YozV